VFRNTLRLYCGRYRYTQNFIHHKHAVTGDRTTTNDGEVDEKDDDDDDEEDEDEDESETGDDQAAEDIDDETAATTHARPRRLSELKTPDKVKPIPDSSSLFVFSPTNRCDRDQTEMKFSLIYLSNDRPTQQRTQ